MNNVLSFPPPKIKEEKESINNNDIEELVDDVVQEFLITTVKNIEGVDVNLLIGDDYHTQKMLAFLRETLISTIYKLKNEDHGIQSIAYDVIYFLEDEENTKELTIELEDV